MSLDTAAALREVAKGNDAFAHGAFGDAVSAYEAAVAAGAGSNDVLYNLGNAYYRAGRVGHAALAWERALREDPGDADAAYNLSVIRGASADRVLAGEDPFFVRLGARTDPDLAAVGLLLCWTLAWAVLLGRRRLVRPFPRAAALAVALALAVGSGLAGAAAWATWSVREDGFAVVVRDARVLEAPNDRATPAFEVHEGLRVRAGERAGGFTRVVLPGGLAGWIPEAAVNAIAENSANPSGAR